MIEILNRWTKEQIYQSDLLDIKSVVEEAVKGGAYLRYANLRYTNLRGADLIGADLIGADLIGANLRDADLRYANLRGANLRDADLRYANLRGADLGGTDLSNADLGSADLRGADLRDLPSIEKIHQSVYAAASKPNALNMSTWHTCETTHCRAGWVITLAGDAGKAMEFCIGTPAAAALIYMRSDPTLEKLPDFYASNEDALADMKRLAELEAARA